MIPFGRNGNIVLKKKNNKIYNSEVNMKKLLLALTLLSTIVVQAYDYNIDKAALFAAIKADIYRVFTQEMWIASKDFTAMAQGNAQLEQDLKDLYASFGSQEAAQNKLDAFCKKWQLDKIII